MPVSLQRRTVGAYGDNILDTFLAAVTLECHSLATYPMLLPFHSLRCSDKRRKQSSTTQRSSRGVPCHITTPHSSTTTTSHFPCPAPNLRARSRVISLLVCILSLTSSPNLVHPRSLVRGLQGYACIGHPCLFPRPLCVKCKSPLAISWADDLPTCSLR